MLFTTDDFLPISVAALAGEVTSDDVDRMHQHYVAVHALERRALFFVDARRSQVPSADIRRKLADMSNSLVEESARNAIATVTILDSKLLVGAMTAVQWFLKSPMELRYFSRATDALAFAAQKLAAESIAMPAGIREFAKKLDLAKPDQLAALFGGDR